MRPVHESIFESNFPTHAPSGAPTIIIEIMGVSNTGDENSGSITEDPTELLEETGWVSPELQVPGDEMPIDDGIVPNIIEIAMLGFGGLLMLPLLLAMVAWVGKIQRRHGDAGYDDDSFDLGSSDDNDSIGGGGGPTGQYGYDYYGEADQPIPKNMDSEAVGWTWEHAMEGLGRNGGSTGLEGPAARCLTAAELGVLRALLHSAEF
eukprot:CAMPEP_0194305360 /NCGR_PEP_ID=MMETSP0171-20130528/2815_1 /TAXON_ID=218684 /ORGANISM="Corethron pennatum, Strain L29A3" /LENGTH=205 /DNA_ID=CAMNT_0039056871 /DNA_START=330 /DNA_END=948 /DNA_ORIENTATION=-